MGQFQDISSQRDFDIQFIEEIHALISKAYDERIRDVNTSIRQIKEIKIQCRNGGYIQGEKICDAYHSFFLMIIGEYKTSISLANSLEHAFENDEDKSYKSLVHYTIGSVHYKSDDYHLGLNHLLICLSIRKEIGDVKGQSQVLKSIGTVYEYFNDYEGAVEAYQQCRVLSLSIQDKLGESNACNPLSGIYLKRGKFEEAMETADRSILLKEEAGDLRGLAYAYHAKAKVYFAKKDFEKSEIWFLKSLALQESGGEKLGVSMCEAKLGELYHAMNDFEKSKIHLHRAIEIASYINSRFIIFKAYHFLYLIAKAENKSDTALGYLEEHLRFKESVINADTTSLMKSFKALSRIEMLEREAKIIKEKNKDIEQKNTELDTFVYRVSHDLRGPIASLMGLYSIAIHDVKDDIASKYIDMYHEQIKRLNDIILDLINLNRIKGWQLKFVQINFEEVINSIINSYKYIPEFDKIKFSVNIDGRIDFKSDKSIITTILQNLIENSIKYARPNIIPEIRIEVTQENDNQNLSIKIEDNGCGIKEEYQTKIYEMFYRANNEKEGSGLGLYILNYAVEKLKGRVEMESQVNVGTSFKITIPVIYVE